MTSAKSAPEQPPPCAKCGLPKGALIHHPPEFEDDDGAGDCHPYSEPRCAECKHPKSDHGVRGPGSKICYSSRTPYGRPCKCREFK